MLQMRTIQRGSRQHHAMHQLHRPHAFEGMSTVGRVVHRKWHSHMFSAICCVDVKPTLNNGLLWHAVLRDIGVFK